MKGCEVKTRIGFRWFDLWVGFYWDRGQRTLYFCPIPMLVIAFDFGTRLHLWFCEIDYAIAENPEEAIKMVAGIHEGPNENLFESLSTIQHAYGNDIDDYFPENWRTVKPNKDFTFREWDGNPSVTKKVCDWIKESGKGYFAGTEY